MEIKKYTSEYKSVWNDFVNQSKNGLFLFNRDFMDYHSDRFVDNSLMFYDDKNKLVALFPANISNDILYSHQGLTFGGFITDVKMKSALMLNVFNELKKYAKDNNILKMIYTVIPHIYHKMPAEEDIYALFRNTASLIRCDISATIYYGNRIRFSKGKKAGVKKAEKHGISVTYSDDWEGYYKILSNVLSVNHNAKPTHTIDELKLLASRFQKNIKLLCSFKEGRMLAGIVLFVYDKVVHTQYIANSEDGRNIGALDKVMVYAIEEYEKSKRYFDFGTSNGDAGLYLNKGLAQQKEQFGARGVAHQFFEVTF